MLNLDNLYNSLTPKPKKKKLVKGNYISRCAQIRPNKKHNIKIPKIIYQTWKTHDVPEKWKVSPESIKKLMPDWEYVLMDDNENREFIKKHFTSFLPYYDAFPYNIQRADAIRYMWLYIHGGIYMDLDFEVQHPLTELFKNDSDLYLVHSGNVGSVVTNSFMASKPRNKFWLEVIEEMKKPLDWYILGKHFQVMCSTGPLMLSRVVARTGTPYYRMSKKDIMPCSVCNITCSTCESYLKPLQGSSWCNWTSTFLNFWLCNWKTVLGFTISVLVIILIFYILWWLRIMNDQDVFRPWKHFHKIE